MRIGRLVYNKKQIGMSQKVFCNFGDNIQTIALDNILQELFPKENIVDINIYNLQNYDGEYVLLPLNCNFWTCDENYFLPASDKIIPVFIAVSFQIPPYSEKAIQYLKKWEPIGCRDYETLRMMREIGVKAYLNGCTTLTLPKRSMVPQKEKIFAVGISDLLLERIQEIVGSNIEVVNQLQIYENDQEGSISVTDEKTKEIYRRYKDEATMVITSKLHCASPCIAMGIPVIVIREKKSCRFEWINKLITVYSPEDFENIDWNPSILEIEKLKAKMRKVISSRIIEAYSKYSELLEISDFFEQCEHEEANSVSKQIIEAVRNSGKDKYAIWGTGGYLGNAIYEILRRECPEVTLVAAFDKYRKECFHGVQTQTLDQLELLENVFVIVTTASGEPEAVQYMQKIGMEPKTDYFVFSMIS